MISIPGRMRLPIIGLGTVLSLLAGECVIEADEVPAKIKEAIEESLDRGGLTTEEERFAPVLAFGAAAVPGVIERFGEETGQRRVPVVDLLCYLNTPDGRKFLKKIAGEREDKMVVDEIFKRFPRDHFEEVMPEAVQAEGYSFNCFFAGERAVEAVRRNPKLAGVMVAALQDQPPVEHYNYRIGYLLGRVTGWTLWQFAEKTDTGVANRDLAGVEFWRKWWKRNEGTTLFDWLEEAYRANPKSAQQKTDALRGMSLLRDRRSAPLCLEALEDPHASVRYSSVCALKAIAGEEGDYTFARFTAEESYVINRLKEEWARRR